MKITLRPATALACILFGSALGSGTVHAAEGISSNALHQISLLNAEKYSRTPVQLKLDSQLVYALKQAGGSPVAPGLPMLRLNVQPDADGRLLLDLTAQVTPALLDAIAQAGGSVQSSFVNFHTVRALIPLAQVENIAGRSDVTFIQGAVPHATRTGSVDSEGDVTHKADVARTLFGVTGAGVKVGVLSDSVDFLAQSQATADLPPNVTVLPGQSGVPGSGEGTAMLEIVHDLAPGAQLFFATGGGGQANFAQNILNLRASGCDIIVDDIFYFNESPFQDAVIARAVNTVTADGALYFSAAGNEGNVSHGTSGTWEGDFVDGGAAGAPVNGKNGTLHSFGASTFDTVTRSGFATILVWSDPLGASTNDYDLYVLDSAGNTVVSSSTTVQNGAIDPFEIVSSPAPGEKVVVVKASGDARFIHIDTIRGRLTINTTGNITGHAVATNAFAVAAVNAATSFPNPFTGFAQNPTESFSTDGPRRVFYDQTGNAITPGNYLSTGGYVRQKPDIAAADGVSTTLSPFSGLNPFFGTSAAAPHAAAIAALLRSYNPGLNSAQISNLLTTSALDIQGTGFDRDSGSGLVMADRVLQIAPIGVNLVVITNYLIGGNGNGFIDPHECNDLQVVLQNFGSSGATNIQANVTTTNLGVLITHKNSAYVDLGSGAVATNNDAFRISTVPSFNCGSTVYLQLVLKSDQGTTTNVLQFDTGSAAGTNATVRFDSTAPVPIPDANLTGASSPIVVTNVSGALSKVTLSLYLSHTFDSDLNLELISPDGTHVSLSSQNGGSGNNYGQACTDASRTVFDDAANTPISASFPPFVGSFRPEQPLAAYIGKSGTNINGTWQLHVVDGVPIDVGTIQCWSLFLSPATCVDGGNQCPGVDLSIGIVANPEPVFIGSNLVYTINITNVGPDTAKSVTMSQLLPNNVTFVTASVSQGSISQSGGVVTANLGNLPIEGVAVATVTVIPNGTGLISSTATVSSSDIENDPSNNSASVTSHVNPPFADLTVGIFDSPDPVLVGQTLTYTVAVTNKGPATANGVFVTNVLPLSAGIMSAVPSQGSVITSGNLVVANLGSLTNGGRATVVINVSPSLEGTITATSTITSTQSDPIPGNNTASASTVVGPSADLAIGLQSVPGTVVLGSNYTYVITVTNRGPSAATGVVVQDSLPAGINLISTNYPVIGNNLTVALGAMNAGAVTSVVFQVNSTNLGTFVNSVTVSGDQGDPNTLNNSASVTTIVSARTVSFAAVSALLTAESLSPTNGTVDPGETVTVQLYLRNTGNVPNTNLFATLLATNGVTNPSAPQNYGIIPAGGIENRPFTFTAIGTNGGTVTATLSLQDINLTTHVTNTSLQNVTFTFALPKLVTFANTNRIDLPTTLQNQQQPGPASPYPSSITVSGLTGLVGRVSVTLSNLNHSFPHDINLLLVGPGGTKVVLMSDAVDGSSVNGANLTFDDGAAAPLPSSGEITSGSWQPSAYDLVPSFTNPAPAGPYETVLGAFNSPNPNGVWSLYGNDDSAGDFGAIAGGWSLTFTTVTPVNQIADIGVTAVSVPSPVLAGTPVTNLFNVSNVGPDSAASVSFSSVLPAGVTFLSANAGQTAMPFVSGSVSANLGSLPPGSSATVSIAFIPNTAGALSNYATTTVSSGEIDFNLANNSAVAVSSATLPVADVAISAAAAPMPVTVGSNLTFTLQITNNGPQNALKVMVSNALPAGVTLVSSNVTQGSISRISQMLVADLGSLANGGTAAVTFVVAPNSVASLTNLASVSTASTDNLAVNNSATNVVAAVAPAPSILPVSAVLTAESLSPPNGSIEAGETVTVSLALTNAGLVDTTSAFTATLLPSGGVNSPSSSQVYGVVVHGGATVSRSFSFTALSTPSGVITAALQLQDGTNNLGQATFSFVLPSTTVLTNLSSINIPDHGAASPYPASITISGLTGVVAHVSVSLKGISHAFPDDIDVMLVSPSGQKIMLMSDAGGGHSISNVDLTFDDNAAGVLPDTAQITSGSYRPTDYQPGDVFPSPAPASPAAITSLANLNGIAPNGTWSLYVVDDSTGDAGIIAGGWSLSLTTIVPVSPVLNLVVAIAATPNPVFVGSALTYSITVTNRGPAAATGIVLTDVLPAAGSLVSGSSTMGSLSLSGGTVSLSVPNLDAGAGLSASLRFSPSANGIATDTVTVSSLQTDIDLASNSGQVTTSVLSPLVPKLDIAPLGNNRFELTVTAEPGQVYNIQDSTNLSAWSSVMTGTATAGGTVKYTATNGPSFNNRFFRAVRLP